VFEGAILYSHSNQIVCATRLVPHWIDDSLQSALAHALLSVNQVVISG
jgi:hypothetical protein